MSFSLQIKLNFPKWVAFQQQILGIWSLGHTGCTFCGYMGGWLFVGVFRK